MALTALRGKKIARKKAPAARRQRGKTADPGWTDALKMSGEAYHKYKTPQLALGIPNRDPENPESELAKLKWSRASSGLDLQRGLAANLHGDS